MPESRDNPHADPPTDIRIIRLNTDKTRKDAGSDTVYHLYFELSDHPPAAWVRMFDAAWEGHPHTLKADIDGAFLVLHAPLRDVGDVIVAEVKKFVHETNDAYVAWARLADDARELREDAWKRERGEVEALAKTIRYE
jgi:hypothetical protein